MDLNDIMISETHQTEKEKYCIIFLIGIDGTPKQTKPKFMGTENRLVVSRGVGRDGKTFFFLV